MGQTVASGRLNQYLETLGVKQGASLEDVNTAYYTLIKKFPQNPTEEEEERLKKVKYAYDYLRHVYAPVKRPILLALPSRKILVPLLSGLAVIGIVVLVAMYYPAIRLKMTHYDNGDVLRFKNQPAAYGQVVGYEALHRFPTGNPSPAYAIRLADREETVWISQRLVVNGMVKASN